MDLMLFDDAAALADAVYQAIQDGKDGILDL